MFYSQFGEDRILSRIFRDKDRGSCVEVGANDGIHGSTSLFFEQRGWECVLIEPNPQLCAVLREVRSAKVFECGASDQTGKATLLLAEGGAFAHAVSTLCSGQEAEEALRRHGVQARPVTVSICRLDEILEEAQLAAIDFISIDVEGHELEVLKGFSLERWRPTIMIIEDNSRLRDRRVVDLMRSSGYVRFLRTGVNDWYAQSGNRDITGSMRRLRYLRSLAAATVVMALAPFKAHLARVPGLLALARKLRNLRD